MKPVAYCHPCGCGVVRPSCKEMFMMRRHIIRTALAGALAVLGALPLPAAAQAFETAGAKYDPSVRVGGRELQINGSGIRVKAIFKV